MTTTDTDTSTAECEEVMEAIRDALRNGDTKRALNKALHFAQARLALLRNPRKGRRADGMHLDAHLAGVILAIAEQAGLHQRPADFPDKPTGYQLQTVFYAAYEAALAHPGEGE